MARSVRLVPLIAALLAGLIVSPLWAETLIYDSSSDNFATWQTNHSSKLYWDSAARAYHYALTDAADDYAFVSVPNPGDMYRLEFDWLPTSTDWAGNLRIGLWDSDMTANSADSIYADYHLDDNGYHLMMESYLDRGSNAIDLGSYVENQWYQVTIETTLLTIPLPERPWMSFEYGAVMTVVRDSDRVTVSGPMTLAAPGGFDRIAMTSIGDSGYPGSTAEGYVKNVKLFVKGAGDAAVFDWPFDGARVMLAPGAVLPMRFHLVDAQGDRISERRDVVLEVAEVTSRTITTTYRFSAADANLQFGASRLPWQYSASFRRATLWTLGGGSCTAVVSEGGATIGSVRFSISSFSGR